MSEQRQMTKAVLQMGIAQLSESSVKEQKAIIRFNALKNEVDIFQQYLDPFIFQMRSPHEHQVNSSVYRHFVRMQGVQDMGIPIYSLGDYTHHSEDKIIVPRTNQGFYRRIRRRNAGHFLDMELIPRPSMPSRRLTVRREPNDAAEGDAQ